MSGWSEQTKKSFFIYCIVALLGIIFGFYLNIPSIQSTRKLESKPVRDPDPRYPLIKPLLGYDNAEATNFGELVDLKNKISNFIKNEVYSKNASKVSVYFRNLNKGRWISINEDEEYTPASLLKVPLALTYYHLSESAPGLLSRDISFDKKSDIQGEQFIKPLSKIEIGTSYTTEQLINRMIVYSDNDATLLLSNNISPESFNKIFSDLDILLPTNNGAQDFISVKNYAFFFRLLFGSTYLSRYNSEKMLELLSNTEFKDGIASGVSKDIVVAHKFGEYGLIDPTNNTISKREFHDCGIVYYPQDPYLLCIMTKGDDLNKLEKTVGDISKLVYTEVKKAED